MAVPEPRPELGMHHLEVDPTVDPLSRFGSRVRALVWPTRTLVGSERWFDELYVWSAATACLSRARLVIGGNE